MANALKTLFGDIANAIRSKNGDPPEVKYKPAEFPQKIADITGGGGSSADVRYVTFMSEDGSFEYGKKAVAVGDDCADPIARGVFDTPTKESTAQYTYTFYGWATTPNGAADSNWNKSITEDKTVYANFASAVRYYTITYYDGSTVLKTESLAYGAMPNYTPEKSGYAFSSWNPALTAVTGDASYSAQWTSVITFANGTWAQIADICAAGNATTAFKVGDSKSITFKEPNGTTVTTTARIIGFDHDDLADGSGKAAITIACAPAKQAVWNKESVSSNGVTGYTAGGWPNSWLRSVLSVGTFNSLDAGLREAIKPVKKQYQLYESSAYTLKTCNDKLWIPSINEYGYTAKWNGSADADGTKYAYTLTNDVTSAIGGVMTRTPYNNNQYYYYRYSPAGQQVANGIESKCYHLCFCI